MLQAVENKMLRIEEEKLVQLSQVTEQKVFGRVGGWGGEVALSFVLCEQHFLNMI